MPATQPDPQGLLPPLLACLPTALVSSRPPPALLPLLSPILRQRLQYSGSVTDRTGWLPLLSWDSQRASRLSDKVQTLELEPHPVSGELEVEHTGHTQFRRLDEETLQTRFELQQYGLLPVYVWCEDDAHGGGGQGWKLAELRVTEDQEDGTKWMNTMEAADEALDTASGQQADDDDYWNSYDQTPGETPSSPPATKRSGQHNSTLNGGHNGTRTADEDYYAGYDTVQPALDNDDPREEDSSAPTHSIPTSQVDPPPPRQANISVPLSHDTDRPTQRSLYPADAAPSRLDTSLRAPPHAPRPISPASSISDASVERLERSAAAQADVTRAEAGVKRFIAAEVRSLFRLASSVGMDADEFREVVGRELEVVGMLEDG